MKYENYFKYMFESIPDYTEIVLLLSSIQNDKEILKNVDF